ncbi:MAG: hypothetical protein Q9183_000454 [Haloplaca sp. 2 TL-2023]
MSSEAPLENVPSQNAPIQNAPIQHMPDDFSPPPVIDPAFIDVSSPDDARVSFRTTDLEAVIPVVQARFPNVDPLYFTKIFRGTITAEGLVWLDVDRQDATPPDFYNLAHLLYCFEVYGQVVCIMAQPQGIEHELELQRALTEHRLRVLKLARMATFDSLNEWHKAVLSEQFRDGQDKVQGWREKRPQLEAMLKRQM